MKPLLLAIMLCLFPIAEAQSGTSVGGGSGTALLSGAFPVVPDSATHYANLETQGNASACHSTADPTWQSQQGQSQNCWNADTIDATSAAGAGYPAPTLIKLGQTPPCATGVTTAIEFALSNPPAVTPTATGTSGTNTIVVSSITGVRVGSTVSGNGIGSGAVIASSWNGTSTTIPLTNSSGTAVNNTATVNGTVTITPTFVSNSIFFRHLSASSTQPSHALYSFNFCVKTTDNTTINGFETDPDVTVNGQQGYESFQCLFYSSYSSPAGHLRGWNGASGSYGAWFDFSPSLMCPVQLNTTQTFEAYSDFNFANPSAGTTTYQSLAYNTVPSYRYLNDTLADKVLTGGSATYTGNAVQIQIDLSPTTPRSSNAENGVVVYMWNIQFWTW